MPIRDLDGYLKRMSHTIEDKLFWLDKVPENCIVFDYGCADGTLLKEINKRKPNWKLIGYDASEEMIERAIKNCKDLKNIELINPKQLPPCYCFSEFNSFTPVLFLSSVVHEIFNSVEEVNKLHSFLRHSNFECVVVRDMFLSDNILYNTANYDNYFKLIMNDKYSSKIISYEHYSERDVRFAGNLTDFLHKYFYEENWEHEAKEYYFPISIFDFINTIQNNSDVKLTFMERFKVDWIDKKIKNDFGITLDYYTHAKLIFKKIC